MKILILFLILLLIPLIQVNAVEPRLILKIYNANDTFPADCNLEYRTFCIYSNDTIFQNETK